jgi:hypothetical protein
MQQHGLRQHRHVRRRLRRPARRADGDAEQHRIGDAHRDPEQHGIRDADGNAQPDANGHADRVG